MDNDGQWWHSWLMMHTRNVHWCLVTSVTLHGITYTNAFRNGLKNRLNGLLNGLQTVKTASAKRSNGHQKAFENILKPFERSSQSVREYFKSVITAGAKRSNGHQKAFENILRPFQRIRAVFVWLWNGRAVPWPYRDLNKKIRKFSRDRAVLSRTRPCRAVSVP